jgi:phage protein D
MTADFYAPRAEVRIEGLMLAANVANRLISLTYDSNTDIADMFTVVLMNPENELTDSPLFHIGKTVEIHMGYGGELEPMMLGTIASVQPSFPESGAPTLTIAGYDRSYALRRNEPAQDLWKGMTDSVIAAAIAAENGLIPVVDPSPRIQEELPQSASDMALLKELARANYFETYVFWDRLYFQFPRPQTEAYRLEWGKNLINFSPRLARGTTEGTQVVRGYDERVAEAVVGVATTTDISMDDVVERLGQDGLDLVLDLGRQAINSRRAKNPQPPAGETADSAGGAMRVATSLLQELMEGLYEGSGSCIGIPALRAGRMINITGVGKRFSGRYRLRRVTHTLGADGYRTHFEVSQRGGATLLPLLRKTLTELPPPNRQQPMLGLVPGKVTQNVDTEHRGRVKVSYPLAGDDSESAWARCATPMAGSGTGAFFLPDKGDEVLVGFLSGQLGKPVVLGSLWNGDKHPPIDHQDGTNALRVIKTKKLLISLDETAGKERVLITHEPTGSQIVIAGDGSITIEAKTDLHLKAKNIIDMTADTVNVKVTNSMNVS